MAAAPPPHCQVILTTLLLSIFLPAAVSQTAPSPTAPSNAINITNILENGRQYTLFIRFLNQTRVVTQIDNQATNSNEGLTVFAPTDNAFNNLPAGTLNKLSEQQHVQLALYHVLPKFYTIDSLQTVSNPVKTLANGQDGGVFGLNFTGGQGNQLNVSTGIVEVSIYNTLRDDFPLAVYQVDQVLLPKEFTEARPPTPPPPGNGTKGGGATGSGSSSGGGAPPPTNPGSGCGKMSSGLGLVSLLGLFGMGLL